MNTLAKKTAHLKWLKALRSQEAALIEQKAQALAHQLASPCDCQAWLRRQARRQVIHKPTPSITSLPELVLVAAAAPKAHRHHDYNQRFEQGEAQWYHIPAASLAGYTTEQVQRIAYVAIGVVQAGVHERTARYLYAVEQVDYLPRHMLTVEQAGSLKASETPYWLFKLAHRVELAKPITHFEPTFTAKIALAKQLLSTHRFTELNAIID